MKRIAVIGSGGSGKSTFSALLGTELNLPVHHLDQLYWKPNWVKTPKDDWLKIQNSLCESGCDRLPVLRLKGQGRIGLGWA